VFVAIQLITSEPHALPSINGQITTFAFH